MIGEKVDLSKSGLSIKLSAIAVFAIAMLIRL